MTAGRLIAVVGASGVGKDSVIAGIHRAQPHMHVVRRVITRAPGLGGEVYDAVSLDQFHHLAKDGAFALHWGAHDLFYGLPCAVHDQLAQGVTCLANLSRDALTQADQVFARLLVLHVTAQPETLARRLALRGRETDSDIAKRLAQAHKSLPLGLNVVHLCNDGPLEHTVAQAIAALRPVGVA